MDALLAVSFGTSMKEAGERSIGAVEKALADAFPGFQVFRAFTSRTVRKILREREQLCVPSVREMLDRLRQMGTDRLLVQPTFLTRGEEYRRLEEELRGYLDAAPLAFGQVRLGSPLIGTDRDAELAVQAIMKELPRLHSRPVCARQTSTPPTAEKPAGARGIPEFMPPTGGRGFQSKPVCARQAEAWENAKREEKQSGNGKKGREIYLLAGHGKNEAVFRAVQKYGDGGFCFVTLEEAEKDPRAACREVEKLQAGCVCIVPFMLSAGRHMSREIGGGRKGSWDWELRGQGIEVSVLDRGLGEYEGIQELYVGHARTARLLTAGGQAGAPGRKAARSIEKGSKEDGAKTAQSEKKENDSAREKTLGREGRGSAAAVDMQENAESAAADTQESVGSAADTRKNAGNGAGRIKAQGERRLRSGFTTGACAAAAAAAAAGELLGEGRRKYISIETPGGQEASFQVLWDRTEYRESGDAAKGLGERGPEMEQRGEAGKRRSICAVRKDSGDDPDVTNGTLVFASLSFAQDPVQKDGKNGRNPVCARQEDELASCGEPAGACGLPEGTPERTEGRPMEGVYCNFEEKPFIYLAGGAGIGRVTKKGLKCPVGYPAINPVPQSMIAAAVRKESRRLGSLRPLYIEISIPEGERLAEKTFNPRLGIEGGISVLGTTGIVNPMSESALVETIRLDIRVQAADGKTLLAAAPGNYGEAFLREQMGLSMDSFVKCSNFVGETFRMMREEGIREVLFAGHIGKLIKVAGGVMNTHSRYGDRRMEILADCFLSAWEKAGEGRPEGLAEREQADFAVKRLLSMNTTDEAAEFLGELGICGAVMDTAAGRVKEVLEGKFGMRTEVILFSAAAGILAATAGAEELAERLRNGGAAPRRENRRTGDYRENQIKDR